MGDELQETVYSKWANHQVWCQRSNFKRGLKRNDWLFRRADQIIAISPFLAKLMRMRYGDKVSVLPFGIDTDVFYPSCSRDEANMVIVSAGHVAPHKRAELFLELARRHESVKFRWFGEGESRQSLCSQAKRLGLNNLQFPGALSPFQLAEEFRKAHVFVMPSMAEGVPKVTQEAAACGLPVVLFGFYEAPSVIDGKNGYVVWSDEELFERVDQLITQKTLRTAIGDEGARMAEAWDWGVVAPMWEERILSLLN